MPRQPKAIVLAVVMALLVALALVGTAGASGGDASGDPAWGISGRSQPTSSQSSDGTGSSGKTSGEAGTAQPSELPTTGTGGYLHRQAPVDLHGFTLLGLVFAGLAFVVGGLAVRKATH